MADGCLLYYITDRKQFPGDEPARRRALLAKIGEAARCGVDYVQLREKDLSARELERLACEAVRVLRQSQQPEMSNQKRQTLLFINSRTDVALASGADGVHLRSEDISANEVRSIWMQAIARSTQPVERGPIIAASCHTKADVIRAESARADFAVFAPVFGKARVPAAGVEALRDACCAAIPVLALGGVTVANASACLEAGAKGIAGIRLFQENKIEDVVRSLRNA
jgi:thiamine-phosphate pyrophosphorylase